MTQDSTNLRSRRALGLLLGTLGSFCFIAPACSSKEGELAPASGGRVNAGGSSAAGGSGANGGALGGGQGGSSGGTGGSAAGAGEDGTDDGGQGGSSAAGAGSTEPPGSACTFHSEPFVDPSAGGAPGSGETPTEGGAGGAEGPTGSGATTGAGGAAPVYDITVLKSAFVGTYLADSAGKALYLYGADQAGDCENLPISTCNDAGCVAAWPIFNAGERALAPGLNDELFGTIERADGSHQTTYLGWPLYYYKSDLAPGDVKGHAVGRVWHLAELTLPNVVLLRIGVQRLLGDGTGKALYVFAEDSIGTSTTSPVSACIGACRRDFPPFAVANVSAVSYLEPTDFSIFVRSDGEPQVAYKGAPLYRARADTRSGMTNGTAVAGFSVAPP